MSEVLTKDSNLAEQVKKLDDKINAMRRRKLITVVEGGGSDKVIFVEPFDLGNKDPEGLEEVVRSEVVDTNYDQGYAVHRTKQVRTGEFRKRYELDPQKYNGPFGPTHRIDTSIQDGKREYEDFKRTLQTHTSRLERVAEPIAYHSEVNEQGVLDLKTRSIEVADVPVVLLENYGPLEKLIERRRELANLAGMDESEPKSAEEVATESVADVINPCGKCEYVGKTKHALAIHMGRFHKE